MRNFLVFLVISTLSVSVFSQIERVEPPFWWAGMRNSELQLLVYGDNISRFEPKTQKGVLRAVHRTTNPNYLFLDLDLKDVAAGTITIDFYEKKALQHSQAYSLLERKPGSAQRKSFDASDVIYLLMPDRFANGNPNNDNHPEVSEQRNRSHKDGRHGGDIEGVIKHLDYIHELGATALWSTPLCEDNDAQGSYHTYAQSNLYRIDPRFGTNEDYKKLTDALHEREMKLIMDYVTNHWGLEHWMLKDLPAPDWIHQFETFTNTNHRKEIFSDPYVSQTDYQELVEGWFVPTMADINQDHPLVLNYLIQNAIWWIEYAGVDGFRVDTYPYNDPQPMVKWVKAILNEYPHFNIVGEGWMHNSIHTTYWQKDSGVGALNGFNSELPSVMDFSLTDALIQAFNENDSHWESGTTRIYKSLQNDFLYPDIYKVMLFGENHDTRRINHIYPDFKDYQRFLVTLMTLRGIPQILYATEIGAVGGSDQSHGDIRVDFPGGWEEDSQNAFVASGRTPRQQQYFSFTKKMLNWRKSKSVIHFGQTLHYVPQKDVYVYFRFNESESVMVVINNHLEAQELSLDRFSEGIQGRSKAREVLTDTDITLQKTLTIPGETAFILELN